MEQEPGPVMVMGPGVTPWMPTVGGVFRANGVFSPPSGWWSLRVQGGNPACRRAQGERPVLVVNIVVVCAGILGGDGFAADQVIGIFLDFRPVVTADVQGFNGRVGVNSGPAAQQKAQHQGGAEATVVVSCCVLLLFQKSVHLKQKNRNGNGGEMPLKKRDFLLL